MARSDQIRLMTKVARMYYLQNIRQAQITERLNLHQSTVSRLLKKAVESGIVRISIAAQNNIHLDLEEALESRFHLKQAVVVDSVSSNEEQLARDLGSAAAFLLEGFVRGHQTIGISSWSAALLEMIRNFHPSTDGEGTRIVQILGGMGNADAQMHATYLAERLASFVGGSAVLLPAPGITQSAKAKDVLLKEQYVQSAVRLWDSLDTVIVGIGALEPSRMLVSSGNYFTQDERAGLMKQGAVGDICLHYFNAAGQPISTSLSSRVIGMSLTQLKGVKHRIGVAGGKRKVDAILGALNGSWINILVTDRATARALLDKSNSSL
jgi:DNA-binding transcriptional regulator LsrR (DeoR family)